MKQVIRSVREARGEWEGGCINTFGRVQNLKPDAEPRHRSHVFDLTTSWVWWEASQGLLVGPIREGPH